MARNYYSQKSDVTGLFPTASYVPVEWKDQNLNGFAHSETFTVPASLPYIKQLDYVPLAQSTITVTVASAARTVIRYGLAVGSAQVAIDMVGGLISFNAADAGLSCTISYTAKGSNYSASDHMRVEAELKAIADNAAFVNGDDRVNAPAGFETNGTQVVGTQQAAIANIGTSMTGNDLILRDKINAILAMLRTHGLIAP